MSQIIATHKDGWQLTVCIADEEFPGVDPEVVGRAYCSHGHNGVPIPDNHWVSFEVKPDSEDQESE